MFILNRVVLVHLHHGHGHVHHGHGDRLVDPGILDPVAPDDEADFLRGLQGTLERLLRGFEISESAEVEADVPEDSRLREKPAPVIGLR